MLALFVLSNSEKALINIFNVHLYDAFDILFYSWFVASFIKSFVAFTFPSNVICPLENLNLSQK